MTGPTKPRFQAQMEGTTLPLFLHKGLVPLCYFAGHLDGIPCSSHDTEPFRLIAFNTRAALARIVAEHRRK